MRASGSSLSSNDLDIVRQGKKCVFESVYLGMLICNSKLWCILLGRQSHAGRLITSLASKSNDERLSRAGISCKNFMLVTTQTSPLPP